METMIRRNHITGLYEHVPVVEPEEIEPEEDPIQIITDMLDSFPAVEQPKKRGRQKK